MFLTLFLKEIHETIITGKFFFASLLCVILIPLGMYVTVKEYEQRLDNYLNAERLYLERSEGRVSADFKAEGYRPPSPFSIFAFGLEQFLPAKAITSDGREVFGETMNGVVKTANDSSLQNPLSVLFGKMDFLYNVGFILSLFAFLFVYPSISGEREQGTLKLLISNAVPRGIVITAKILGNYVVFLVPFLVSFLVGIVIVALSGAFPITTGGFVPVLVIMLAVSVAFLLCVYVLGMLVSAMTRSSSISVVVLLFIWTLMALVIPRLSPMLAQIVRPVESEQVITSKIENLRMDIRREQSSREDALFLQVLQHHGVTNMDYMRVDTKAPREAIESEYDELVLPVRNEYAEKMREATTKLQREYDNAVGRQQKLTMVISRVSPICCFTYVLTELAGTGVGEINSFRRQAEVFQERVMQSVYDKYWFRQYGAGMYNILGYWVKPGVDADNLPVPRMTEYHRETIAAAFGRIWVDALLLGLYTVLFFSLAFVKFLKYDVR